MFSLLHSCCRRCEAPAQAWPGSWSAVPCGTCSGAGSEPSPPGDASTGSPTRALLRPSPTAVEGAELFLGNAGTAMRPLTAAVAAAGRGRFVLDGVARMRERPIQDLVDGLVQVGLMWGGGEWVQNGGAGELHAAGQAGSTDHRPQERALPGAGGARCHCCAAVRGAAWVHRSAHSLGLHARSIQSSLPHHAPFPRGSPPPGAQLGVKASCTLGTGCPPVEIIAEGLPSGKVSCSRGQIRAAGQHCGNSCGKPEGCSHTATSEREERRGAGSARRAAPPGSHHANSGSLLQYFYHVLGWAERLCQQPVPDGPAHGGAPGHRHGCAAHAVLLFAAATAALRVPCIPPALANDSKPD